MAADNYHTSFPSPWKVTLVPILHGKRIKPQAVLWADMKKTLKNIK